ncbi:MAG TPA: hypothetical protein VFD60_11650 [Nitrososphaeraceae archaeon]|nr:hypothetical protein [Nitrososphaeraceae archaeon]
MVTGNQENSTIIKKEKIRICPLSISIRDSSARLEYVHILNYMRLNSFEISIAIQREKKWNN